MNPYAHTMRCHICRGESTQAYGATDNHQPCKLHARAGSPIIESAAEQPWVDFCGTLDAPVFLLAHSGYGDLI